MSVRRSRGAKLYYRVSLKSELRAECAIVGALLFFGSSIDFRKFLVEI